MAWLAASILILGAVCRQIGPRSAALLILAIGGVLAMTIKLGVIVELSAGAF